MLVIISPAKTLDFTTKPNTQKYSFPTLLDHSSILIEDLQKCSVEELTKLMNISYGLAETNLKRFLEWKLPFTPSNAKQSILAFNGDVYEGINTTDFNESDFENAQNKVRILSGLYGILKPLDLILPYRLPMGTKFPNLRGKNLYEFWGNIVTDELNNTLESNNSNTIVNLASKEYFDVLDIKKLKAKVIEIIFKEEKNGVFRVVSFYAKKARGLMTRFIVKNNITNIEDLKNFALEDYKFDPKQSNSDKFVFFR